MKHGSLFSGIGGFDLAAQWMGWENVFHCEWNPFGKRVLKYYWPKAISYNDITQTDFTIHRGTIDILTGGFPCQPFSMAGKRKGTEDDRHLWPEMLRAIREIQPRFIVGENVSGILNWSKGLVFEQVCADLESEGYEVQPVILPAVSVNAPHRRDRVWFVACSKSISRRNGTRNEKYRTQAIPERRFNELVITSDTPSQGREEWKQDNGPQNTEKNGSGMDDRIERQGDIGTTSDTGSARQQEQYASSKSSRKGFGAGSNIKDWSNWPTVSPICERNDGLSDRLSGITFPRWRNEGIKAMGNGVVPQIVYQIFKAIEQSMLNHEI